MTGAEGLDIHFLILCWLDFAGCITPLSQVARSPGPRRALHSPKLRKPMRNSRLTAPRPLRTLTKRRLAPGSEAKMTELAEVEQRVRAALGRIDAGIDRLPIGGPSAQQTEQIAHLQALLDAERQARAEAEAQLADLHEAVEAAAVEQGDARLLRQIDAQGLDNQRLRASVAALREEVRRLSEALAEGLGDASLINHALVAELESLRAQRASETTEMTDILSELDRIVTEGETAHA
jgi:chromosome segregation ATPase